MYNVVSEGKHNLRKKILPHGQPVISMVLIHLRQVQAKSPKTTIKKGMEWLHAMPRMMAFGFELHWIKILTGSSSAHAPFLSLVSIKIVFIVIF